MNKMWLLYFSVAILSIMQIPQVKAAGCNILSVTSPSASSFKVVWSAYSSGSVYVLDFRVVNSTTISPLMVMPPPTTTETVVQGLRPGYVYDITLRVLVFWNLVCKDTKTAMTVPAAPQITFSEAVSSTSIRFEWTSVMGAVNYTIIVEEFFKSPAQNFTKTFTASRGQIDDLNTFTTYSCKVYASNSAGRSALSNTRIITTLVQPPTYVKVVATGRSTAQVTWSSVDKVLLYQVAVSDNKNPSNMPVIRNTTTTSFDISNLEPCSTYTVGVSSFNFFLVPGEAANVTHTTSSINSVTTVSATYSCSGGSVTVTWDVVFGASLYRATAVGGSGASSDCTSASTSCQISSLKCGEKYEVRVTALSGTCSSTSNISSMFETVSCAPANPQTSYTCNTNVVIFSWQPTNNTLYYVATSLDGNGMSTKCQTIDNTCYFTDAVCAQNYTYRVYAVTLECNTDITEPVVVQTSPCLPTNLRRTAECDPDRLVINWDDAAGALSYFVEAKGNTKESYNCTTSSTSCEITNVPCGEHLSVFIVASNNDCTSPQVLGEVAQTVPCTPDNVTASVDCSQNSARVDWMESSGVILYVIVAQDANGNSSSYMSVDNTGMIDGLRCGQSYTASVFGTDFICNSTTSKEVSFMTAPCPPTNIDAFRDCDANHAVIVWQNHQSTGLYTATIADQSGDQLNCTSNTVNNCTITPLPCGKKYNVSVTYNDGNCPSASNVVAMDSVPCGPEEVRAHVDCTTGELTVSWNVSTTAENYITTISRGTGQPLYCNSTETRCSRGGLECGSSYAVTVFSITGTCKSLPSTEVTVDTLPCPPTNVTVTRTCGPHPVPVSWLASDGAKYYTAVAVSSEGHRSECTTNKTSCCLTGLQCGEIYTVGVAGADDKCATQQSRTVSVNTEPCAPSNVSSQLICSTRAAHVSWDPSPNALSYAVEAISNGQTVTCNSSSPNCTLSNLLCGQAYEILVTATDGTCVSNYSAPFRQDQVPCAPGNISTDLSCSTNDLTVSWISSSASLKYSVTAVPLAGNTTSVICHTDGASCVLSGLQCGQTFHISVKASSGSCDGPHSPSQIVQTAPCSPQSLAAVTDCGSNSLLVSWNSSLGASNYTAKVMGPDAFSKTCSSSDLRCSFFDLRCATQYNITVASKNNRCTSAPIQTAITTGPCDAVNVTSVLHCDSDVATVSWIASAGALTHTVIAKDGTSYDYISCRSNTNSCQLKQLQCGKVYNLTVMAEDATCNSTGTSQHVIMTAPCPPTFVNNTLICGTDSSFLSWTPVADATGYTADARALNGHKVSCSSTTASCTLTDLQCSETYTATVIALGNECDSAPGTRTTITTAPCSPVIISKQYTCGTNTAVFRWTGPAGSLSFLTQVEGEGLQDGCHTTNTSCMFENLPCGLDLNVTVQAQGAQCNSSPSVNESLETVACAPRNVSAALLCLNHSALVTWVGSPSAIRYKVTATAQDGHTHHCHTNSTSCQVLDIHCGETYSITVTPYSQTCTGNPSAAYSFQAGRCAPGNITVSPACEGNSTVSWFPVMGADMYIATAMADDGHTHTCSSNYLDSCNFTDLHCGETYALTVVTVDRGCWSKPSSTVQLRTALCPPTNLMGHVSCDANTLTLTWDPVTGAIYVLQYEQMGSARPHSANVTSNYSHTLSNLLCGQRYAFRIAAQDGNCRSSYSPPIEISTAPCQPTNLTVRVDCGTNNGNFSWDESSSAGFYTVQVTGEHGHTASCSSNDTSCAVKLHCGHSYSATLVASTESCNSSKHADIYFDSAPCLPEDVVADLDCNTNMMNVTWSQTPGTDNYTAWAISSTDDHRASCNSTYNSCSIRDLQCGKVYEVVVTSSSVHCKVIAGSDYKVQSAPCKPENTTVDQNCSSGVITIKWNQGDTKQNYTVKATSASGVNSTCDSTQSSCSFLDLSCGQLYTFTVMGHTNVCMSEWSTPIEKLTGPCPPTNVSAELNCTTYKALVTWSNTAANTGYMVQATSANGHSSNCSEMGTSCRLNSLVCGQEYSVIVEAVHPGCPGPASAPVTITTEPCVPMNVSFHYNVSTAQVQWSTGSGASSYSVRAGTKQGLSVTCSTANTDCVLTGLQCSQTYSITVMAQNQACDGQISDASLLMTEPCPPTNIQANVSCGQPTATVSWQQSDLAAGYVAYLNSQRGRDTFCIGTDTDTSCVVSGLMCGTVYSVRVKALGRQYNSSDSIVVPLTSGPCEPSNIEVIYDCGASSANILWRPSDGAVLYITVLTASSGHTAYCITNNTSCQPRPLRCGEEYTVTVKAVGETCNSSSQMTGYLTTEPCVPTNVSIDYNSSTARVMWNTARGAVSYSVQAVSDRDSTVTCNTTNRHCSLTALQCSHIYSIAVMTQSLACNNTVSSAPYRLMTEPCPPTNVQASMSCRQLTSTVSWQQSDLALGYVASFDNRNGHYTSCMSTNTSCVVPGLMCGTAYSVWVKALGQQYNSSDSSVVPLTSAPCLPRDMTVKVNCTSDNAVLVSWNGTHGTTNISLMAVVGGSLQTLCTTQQESCNMTSLRCGETYSLSINGSNDHCSLSTQTLSNFTTRPCPPQRVAVNLQCSSRTAVLSWEERTNAELYTASAIKASGGEKKTCDSVISTCQFSGLDCGEMYNFTVTAHNRGCCSQPSSPVFILTEPCPPMNVSAEVLCESQEVKISWQEASGAESFLVTVSSSDRFVKTHNTNQTLLRASLPCGQDFNVTVRGQGSTCNGILSSPAFFKTAPCIPRGLATNAECGFDVGSVSWQPTDGTETYIAVATGLDGHAHRCVSNTTSCTWSDLHCGEEYRVVVRAKSHNCTSLPSNSSIIHMDPCAPQNLSAAVNCDMKVVSLSWDAGNGAKMYTVSAEAGNKSLSLNTNMTTASFSGFTCGQNYSIKITPHSRHCPGNSSASASVQTWPCKPMGVSARQDCLTSIAVVTWQPSNGSNVYMATMQTDIGVSEMCMSDTNQCSFPGLMCGHNFSVSVTASNQQCNVTSSPATSLQSVPCVPTDVSVVMDCANNTAVVSWAASQGAVKYSVTAHSARVNNDSCQTSGLSCSLNNLTCGRLYTVQVVAMDDSCSSVPSWPLKFNSSPCPPQNVSAQVSCLSNNLTVSWDVIGDADHFLVSLAAENGESELCNTTNTVCFSSNATCGKTFTVQVTSVREHCHSVHSQTQSIQSAPCQPQGINGSVDCVTNSAWISWLDAPGADGYTVSGVAVGGNDYRANCTTSTNTTCEMKGLACGVLYNFSVLAKNSQCESQPSAPISLETAPCSLSAITAVPQCHNSSILVVWDLMEGSKRNAVYTAAAKASDHTFLSCNNTGTSCSLQEAQCGLHYTIMVAASSNACSSMRSPPSRVSMEPCPPTDVRVNAACEHHRAVVSWTPSPVAETYHVVAEAADGHTRTCNTSSTNCSLSELHCDEQYAVFVTAGHENCSSKASQNVTLNTGPCQPSGLSVRYQCSNQSVTLTWTPSGPAKDYYGCAQAGNGDKLYCHSTNPSCAIDGLDCGTVYNFSVQASDGTCNSSFSDPVQTEAVPCPSDIAEVQLFPMQEEIQVMRFSWAQITCGDTEYMLTLTGSLLGDNQALFELSSYWTNVTYFEFPLPCSSNYSATMKSRNAAGMSDTSVRVYGTTAPCPPSGVVYVGNSSFATVSWNTSVFAVNYTVYDNSITPKVQLCSTAGLSCSLSNIASSNLAITAGNTAGESEATNVTKTVTHARRRRDLQEQMSLNGSISAPVLDVTHTTSTVISITWSKVEGASYYSLLVIKQSRSHEHQQLMVYGESIVLTDMRPNSTYCISVLAIYADASGPESEPICVRTDRGLPQ